MIHYDITNKTPLDIAKYIRSRGSMVLLSNPLKPGITDQEIACIIADYANKKCTSNYENGIELLKSTNKLTKEYKEEFERLKSIIEDNQKTIHELNKTSEEKIKSEICDFLKNPKLKNDNELKWLEFNEIKKLITEKNELKAEKESITKLLSEAREELNFVYSEELKELTDNVSLLTNQLNSEKELKQLAFNKLLKLEKENTNLKIENKRLNPWGLLQTESGFNFYIKNQVSGTAFIAQKEHKALKLKSERLINLLSGVNDELSLNIFIQEIEELFDIISRLQKEVKILGAEIANQKLSCVFSSVPVININDKLIFSEDQKKYLKNRFIESIRFTPKLKDRYCAIINSQICFLVDKEFHLDDHGNQSYLLKFESMHNKTYQDIIKYSITV